MLQKAESYFMAENRFELTVFIHFKSHMVFESTLTDGTELLRGQPHIPHFWSDPALRISCSYQGA